jgi:hypothetical protein
MSNGTIITLLGISREIAGGQFITAAMIGNTLTTETPLLTGIRAITALLITRLIYTFHGCSQNISLL